MSSIIAIATKQSQRRLSCKKRAFESLMNRTLKLQASRLKWRPTHAALRPARAPVMTTKAGIFHVRAYSPVCRAWWVSTGAYGSDRSWRSSRRTASMARALMGAMARPTAGLKATAMLVLPAAPRAGASGKPGAVQDLSLETLTGSSHRIRQSRPGVDILLRADYGFARGSLMARCEANGHGNRIEECQMDLFAAGPERSRRERTSANTMRANQFRLWFSSMAYVPLCALHRIGLRHCCFPNASCGTISVRRIKIAMASAAL